jgi:hypothetical protein
MGTWGPGNFENDAALDFIDEEIDRHVREIEAIFADEQRFLLDEDAEGGLIPRVVLLTLLCQQCGGVLEDATDVAVWKERYLAMYDEQIDGLEPDEAYKTQRRAVIADTFDRLIELKRP